MCLLSSKKRTLCYYFYTIRIQEIRKRMRKTIAYSPITQKKPGISPPHRREIRGHEKPPPHGYICQSLQNARRFGSRNSDGRKIDPSRAEFPCRTGICSNKIFISLQKTFARGRAATTVSVQRILRDKSPRPPPHRSSLVQRTATQAAPPQLPCAKDGNASRPNHGSLVQRELSCEA